VSRILAALLTLAAPALGSSQAPPAAPLPRRPAAPPGAELRVYLMTMGPGAQVWERFGHNAIWIHDPAAEPDTTYNYGLFDFNQENFLLRFIRGQMWYWMAGIPAAPYVQSYVRDNRSVWLQELNLPPRARAELRDFLRWNERPENRFYHYDYYRDNCSTRVRDAIDRVIGGALQAQTDTVPTGTTYRFHTQRLVANDPPIFTGLLLALGPGVDRPISAWEEMFLPLALREHLRGITMSTPGGDPVPLVAAERTLFESTAEPPPDAPPPWLLWYLLTGTTVGALVAALGRMAHARRIGRLLLGTLSVLWGLLAGLGGIVLAGLWALTDHAMAYRNENLLQVNPLALGVAIVVPMAIAGSVRGARWARGLTLGLAAISLSGLILQVVPGLDQVNGPVIALTLPIHLGFALALQSATFVSPPSKGGGAE
jgi:hypothetical protein